jgi:GNAT superfamily N-acetyltransferase
LSGVRRIEKLSPGHDLAEFDCGDGVLTRWLQKYALASQNANTAQTYLGLADANVIGFYSLAAGQIDYDQASPRLQKGIARHPIPTIHLARLAVDLRWQRQGVGHGLMKDAVFRTLQAAEIAGIRAITVHAKDENAARYYQQFDFAPAVSDPLYLYVLLKDIRRIFQ